MKLLLLITGKTKKILHSNGFDSTDFNVIKIDDKLLAKPVTIVNFIKSGNYSEVYFGCIENGLQRFQFFMNLYILLTFKNGGLLDESGNKIRLTFGRFLFKGIPHILIESVASIFVVVYFYIKLPFLKRRLRRIN